MIGDRRELGVRPRVAAAHLRLGAVLGEALQGVLADHLQHPVARRRPLSSPQVLIARAVWASSVGLSRTSPRPPPVYSRRRTRRAIEDALFLEQVVAPCDRVADRLLAGRQVPGSAREQLQPIGEPRRGAPPAGQPEARRPSSTASGSPSSRRQIFTDPPPRSSARQLEPRLRLPRPPLDEQRHGAVASPAPPATAGRRAAARAAGPRTRFSDLHAQQRAAGHEHLQGGGGRRAVGSRARSGPRPPARNSSSTSST